MGGSNLLSDYSPDDHYLGGEHGESTLDLVLVFVLGLVILAPGLAYDLTAAEELPRLAGVSIVMLMPPVCLAMVVGQNHRFYVFIHS